MQLKNKISHFLTFSLVALSIFCIGVFTFLGTYMTKQNEKTINHVGSIYMQSMNDRISKHFSTMVDLRLTQLDTLVSTIPISREKDSDELREWMEYNAEIRGFESLAYYFDDGSYETIFGEQVESVDPELFMESMRNGERKISVGADSEGERAAVIGVPFEIEMQDGRKCIAMVGRMSFDYISETLSLEEEDALIYSFIMRKDGTFVVRSAGASRDTYFERIRALYDGVEGMSVEEFIAELQQAMDDKEDYTALITIDGERRQMYCSALPSSEWYLLTIMPYGTLNEAVETQGRHLFYVFTLSCVAILAFLIVIFIRYFRMNRAQIKELEEVTERAEKASRSKSEFLSNMSHDIRTPMNAIVGMTSIAMDNIGNTERVQDCLKKITLSSKHLLGLINDVLDMSKIESGKMNLNIEFVSLREMMESIVTITQPQIKEKEQKFNVFIYNIISENVLCDGVRLNQILINLLSNAIKYTPEKGAIEVSLYEQKSPKVQLINVNSKM